jgi:hypothetical protein
VTSRRTLLLGVGAALFAAPAFARARFRRLFNGRNLDGWTPLGDANWSVENGVIRADRGGFSFLVSRESYRDFELRVEFRVSHDANSGIFIRCSDRARITAGNAYEVNIYDTRPDPSYGTGAIVDVARVSPMPRAGDRWNVMTIRASADLLSVAMNGVTTVDPVRDAAHREGPVALQYGAGRVMFRRVDIRPL